QLPDGPVEIDRVPVDDSGGDEAQARHVGCGFDVRLGAVRSLFVATRRAAASATRAHVTSSSGSSNSRSGARQKERSMVQPFFSSLRAGKDSASLKAARLWSSTRK